MLVLSEKDFCQLFLLLKLVGKTGLLAMKIVFIAKTGFSVADNVSIFQSLFHRLFRTSLVDDGHDQLGNVSN